MGLRRRWLCIDFLKSIFWEVMLSMKIAQRDFRPVGCHVLHPIYEERSNQMKYIVVTEKNIDQAAKDLEAAVVRNKFGVLHIHDLKSTMKNKGIDFPHECRIFEVCNPQKAKTVLTNDMSLNMALPCRISVWEDNGQVKIGTLKPTDLLSILSDAQELKPIAKEVEDTIIKIIDETK